MGKRAKPEEIIAKLREVEVRLSQGETTGQVLSCVDGPGSASTKFERVMI